MVSVFALYQALVSTCTRNTTFVSRFFIIFVLFLLLIIHLQPAASTTCSDAYIVKAGDDCSLITNRKGITIETLTRCTNAMGYLSNGSLLNTSTCALSIGDQLCLSCSNSFSSPSISSAPSIYRRPTRRPTVKSPTTSLLSDWAICSFSSECVASCCSSKYTNDGKLKCTPLRPNFDPVANGCIQSSPVSSITTGPSVSPVLINTYSIDTPIQTSSDPTVSSYIFNDSLPLVLCDFSSALSAGQWTNQCTGVQGIIMNTSLSFTTISPQNGHLSVNSSKGLNAYFNLDFHGYFDARGYNSIALTIMTSSATASILVDVGVSSMNRTFYSDTYNISQGFTFRPIEIPMYFFNNLDLESMSRLGFTITTDNEVRIQNIQLTRKAYVTRTKGTLFEWVNGTRRVFKFSSFNAPDMIGRSGKGQDAFLDPWEQEDLFISAQQMNARAIRILYLHVQSSYERSQGYGFSKAIQGSRSYGEPQLIQLDRALNFARQYGIRLIFPFLDNWSFFGGVSEFASFRGKQHNDFFYDVNLKADYKELIRKVLTRINTVNGVIYKEDPSILAWQLGSEFCLNRDTSRDAVPVAWTAEMADFVRSLDRYHLIMDGTWDNKVNYGTGDWFCDTSGCLSAVPNLDILSAHIYGSGLKARLAKAEMYAGNSRKAFIADEYGLSSVSDSISVMNAVSNVSSTVSGALIWSIRSQSVSGGAIIHGEGDGFFAYHWPGYTGLSLCNGFTEDNHQIVTQLTSSSISISDSTGIGRPSIIHPPCSHIPKLVQVTVATSVNTPYSGCARIVKHLSYAQGNYRRVNFMIRQATGSFTNLVQISLEGKKFKTLGTINMTIEENNIAMSHYVPVSTNSSNVTIPIYYRVVGLLSENRYSTASAVVLVSFPGIDTGFIMNLPDGPNPTAGAPVCFLRFMLTQKPSVQRSTSPSPSPIKGNSRVPSMLSSDSDDCKTSAEGNYGLVTKNPLTVSYYYQLQVLSSSTDGISNLVLKLEQSISDSIWPSIYSCKGQLINSWSRSSGDSTADMAAVGLSFLPKDVFITSDCAVSSHSKGSNCFMVTGNLTVYLSGNTTSSLKNQLLLYHRDILEQISSTDLSAKINQIIEDGIKYGRYLSVSSDIQGMTYVKFSPMKQSRERIFPAYSYAIIVLGIIGIAGLLWVILTKLRNKSHRSLIISDDTSSDKFNKEDLQKSNDVAVEGYR